MGRVVWDLENQEGQVDIGLDSCGVFPEVRIFVFCTKNVLASERRLLPEVYQLDLAIPVQVGLWGLEPMVATKRKGVAKRNCCGWHPEEEYAASDFGKLDGHTLCMASSMFLSLRVVCLGYLPESVPNKVERQVMG